ncbi:M23 family metallopeptidase [Pengzhenrongella frigida]|uniref:M23 family metallopeptidase n=1 Tax=Pengzhenrongella frigida TaxID=1259133 RepID=A0A4Q5N3E8_9MICO|nr:M23 family metallopeptidase [Cellulomonas sp. HLT2-17]RYV51783.1 M23 family metallopeptidase [Cellulomonas sp. HLT2-17]
MQTLGAAAGVGVVVAALALGLVPAGTRAASTSSDRAGAGAGARTVVYVLPLAGDPPTARVFAAPAEIWAAGHRGVDLAGAVGQDVRAPASGTVAFAGTVVDRGVLTIAHPDGLRSSLEPVQWSVSAGMPVVQGEPVGVIQAMPGHCAPATCLHWGVRRAEVYLDPLTLVRTAGPVVLLADP